MAQMIFPPVNWTQTVTTVDSIQLEYTSSYPNVNLTLYCEVVKGSDDWIKWYLPGPLPANGTFNLHLSTFAFTKSINVWPTACHFDLTNSRDGKQFVNGGHIPLTTKANAAETTYSRSATSTGSTKTSSIQTLSSPTGVSSVTSKAVTGTQPAATATVTAIPAESPGLSNNAKIGIGVGAGAGGLLIILLAIWTILLCRKRRRHQTRPVTDGWENAKFEKAELMGSSMPQHRDSNKSYSNFTSQGHWEQAKHSEPSQTSGRATPQELPAMTPPSGGRGQHDELTRYEMAA